MCIPTECVGVLTAQRASVSKCQGKSGEDLRTCTGKKRRKKKEKKKKEGKEEKRRKSS
jgi:hypothetical protein